MSTPSEQLIVNALRRATDRMALPPESRWIRERRASSPGSTLALVVAAAVLVIAVGGAINALRTEPRVVPASGVDPFMAREDAAWARVRSDLPSDFVVLRPSWIPAEFRGSGDCPSPTGSAEALGHGYARGPTPSYTVDYKSNLLSDGMCAGFELVGAFRTGGFPEPGAAPTPRSGCVPVGTLAARGTVVGVQTCVEHGPQTRPPGRDVYTWLWWTENGGTYQIGSRDIELADLIRIVRSLEPVR